MITVIASLIFILLIAKVIIFIYTPINNIYSSQPDPDDMQNFD